MRLPALSSSIALAWLLSACQDDATPPPSHRVEDAQADEDARRDAEDAEVEDTSAPADDAGAAADASRTDAAGTPADASLRGPTLDQVLEQYRSWTPRQSEPRSISFRIATLCRLPSLAERAYADSEHGMLLYTQDFANASANQTIQSASKPFSEGAAFVKEKLKLDSIGQFELVARALMVKRGAGFDPAHGDWEFGYWEPASGLGAGAESQNHCGGCHAGAETDFVFVDEGWRLP